VVIRVERAQVGRPIPPGFIGLSLEYGAVPVYAGWNSRAINLVLARLIRNLTPGGGLVLRIGGDSADWTWWPSPGIPRPAGVSYTLSPRWLSVMRALAAATNARLIFDLNLEANNYRIAATEAHVLIRGIGRRRIAALEIGNEPEQYSTRWYQTADGQNVPGRPPGYDLRAYTRQFSLLTPLLPHLPLAGPATGNVVWLSHVSRLLAAERRLRTVTFHRYPLNNCVTDPSDPRYPTIAHLLSLRASRGPMAGVGLYIGIVHAHGAIFRVDELGPVTCGGRHGVSDTFSSALWVLDALFEMARRGVDGVNVHVRPGAPPNQLFSFRHVQGRWVGSVRPEYYGLLMFMSAAPPGSRLLRINTSRGGTVRAWATRTRDGRLRVVLINESSTIGRPAMVLLPGRPHRATLERLKAPGAAATSGVTLGGQTFGSQTSGALSGRVTITTLRPRGPGRYELRLGPASAAMLAVPAG
jgi:hypothetical protein